MTRKLVLFCEDNHCFYKRKVGLQVDKGLYNWRDLAIQVAETWLKLMPSMKQALLKKTSIL